MKKVFRNFVMMLTLLGIMFLVGCGSNKTINLNSFVDVDISGLDTQGKATVTVDYEGIELAVIDSMGLKLDDEDVDDFESLGAAFDDLEKVSRAMECFSFIVTPEKELKNGDVVTVTAQIDEVVAKELGIKFSYKTSNFEVSGLTEPIIITKEELFNNASVVFTGISPFANAKIENTSTDPILSQVNFYTEGYNNLRKGDTFTVFANGTEVLAEQGYLFEETSKEFVVEDVDSYVMDIGCFSEEQLQSVLKAAESTLNGLVNKNCDNSFWVDGKFYASMNSFKSISKPTITTSYFFKMKENVSRGSLGSVDNLLGITYKFDLVSMGGGMFEQPAKNFDDCYIMLCCSNLILTKDGSLTFDIDRMEFTTGYASFEDFYAAHIEPSKERYTIKEVTIENDIYR